MAATDHRRIRPALAAVAGVAVVALVAIGPCRTGGDDVDLGPLPAPAVDGLELAAEITAEVAVVEGVEEAVLEVTVRLDRRSGHAIEVPGLTGDADIDDTRLLAHRERLPDGSIVLGVGWGKDPEENWEDGPRDRPIVVPELIEPGDTVELDARTAQLRVEGHGQRIAATREDIVRAGAVRVCLWGIVHPADDLPSRTRPPSAARPLVCDDVSRGLGPGLR